MGGGPPPPLLCTQHSENTVWGGVTLHYNIINYMKWVTHFVCITPLKYHTILNHHFYPILYPHTTLFLHQFYYTPQHTIISIYLLCQLYQLYHTTHTSHSASLHRVNQLSGCNSTNCASDVLQQATLSMTSSIPIHTFISLSINIDYITLHLLAFNSRYLLTNLKLSLIDPLYSTR
jgi:hypothetical protein